MLAILFGLIVLWILAVVAMNEFNNDFVDNGDGDFNTYCHSLLHCYMSTINFGIR